MAEELRKIFMAGVGAVASAVEKTADAISEATKGENRERVKATVEDLAKKGENAFEKGKTAGGELIGKIGDAFSGLKNVEADDIKARLSDLADEGLDDLERAISEVKRWRAAHKDAGGEGTGAHPESGDKTEDSQADMEKAADATATREDAEDLSEGTKDDE